MRSGSISLLAVFATIASGAAGQPLVSGVAVSPAFFNPTLGKSATVRFDIARAGTATLSILDRDRFVVRKLQPLALKAGTTELKWDGKDDAGVIVPDEAYSMRVSFEATNGAAETYDPSEGFVPVAGNPGSAIYSRVDGVLSYTLPRPSRVHIQAGRVIEDSKGGAEQGPVLRTVLDREPRVGGALVEKWNGFDESGTIYVPALPGFRISIAATSLPESSVIAVGNRTTTFFDYASAHRSPAEKKPRPLPTSGHEHHQGLNTFEDHAPSLSIALDASRDGDAYRSRAGSSVKLSVKASADRAPYFFSQPATLMVFVDDRSVAVLKATANPSSVTIGSGDLPPGEHHIAVNWASSFGPVAVQAARIVVGPAAPPRGSNP